VIAQVHEAFPKDVGLVGIALLIAIPAFIIGAFLTSALLWAHYAFGRVRAYVVAAVVGVMVLRPLLQGGPNDLAVELPSVAGYAAMLSAVSFLLKSRRAPRSLFAKSVVGGLVVVIGALAGSFVAYKVVFG
jgi:hypothetical protein